MSSTQGSGHQCDICFKFLSSSSSLRAHKVRHRPKDELPFHCMFCPYKSAAKRDLLYHHNQHVGHVRQVYKCDLCSKVFQRSSSLSEHINSAHSKSDLYHCEKCNYSTSSRSCFRAHQQVHSGSQIKLICPICESFFKNKSSLKFHLMTHADAKPFQCDKCDKKFSIRKRLLAHVRVIHCPKMFTCNECQKSFATLLNLHRHSLTHSGERPFECCFCPSTSNTRGNIVKHVRKVHNMVNYTFKDIQRENGLREDPKANLTPEDLEKVTIEGRIMSHYYINKMKEKGLTDLSLDQLERAAELKRNHKEEVASRSAARAARKNILKYSANKSSDVHKFEPKTQRRSNSLASKVGKLRLEAPVAHNIVIQPDESSGGGGSREELTQFPTSTATPIQVIWRGSGGTFELSTTGNRKTKKTTSKRKTAPPPKEELSKQPVQTPSLDSSSSLTNLNSASAAPHEDTELSLQCKSLLSSDQDNQSHVLATLSSNNAPSEFVDLEELSSCSSVAISSNANLEVIDKNGDYCHFLGMEAEVGPSFLHSFESVVSQGAVCKVDSTFHHEQLNKTCQAEPVSDNYQHVQTTSPNLQTESQSIFQSVVDGSDIDSSNNVGTSFKLPEKKTSSRTNSSSEEIVQVDSVDCLIPNFGDDGNEPRSSASSEPTVVTQNAEFDHGTEFLSIIPLVEGGNEPDFQSSKEILIRNVQLDESIPNGEVNITSIAEIRVEEESDVILLVDCFR